MTHAQEIIKRIEQAYDKRQAKKQIKCPACGYVFGQDAFLRYVTYWGESGPQDGECHNCESPLQITEHVERTFDVELVKGA